MNAPIPLYVNEVPVGLIQHRVAAAFSFVDAIRSAYLSRCCRQDFQEDDAKMAAQAAWNDKARITREANAERRRQMMLSATIRRAP